MKLIVFDEDGNVIDQVDLTEPDAAAHIGHVVLQHYELVDSIPGADSQFLTIKREGKTPEEKRKFARRIYPLG